MSELRDIIEALMADAGELRDIIEALMADAGYTREELTDEVPELLDQEIALAEQRDRDRSCVGVRHH